MAMVGCEGSHELTSMTDSTAPPTALLWAYYYHALHLSHPLHPNPSASRSLDLISKAHNHTPTLPEVYMAQAMVLKRAGDPLGAAQAMEEARLLDGQDRFLNSKAVKYWLRAGEIKKAEELAAMFTKVGHAQTLLYVPMLTLTGSAERHSCGYRSGRFAV